MTYHRLLALALGLSLCLWQLRAAADAPACRYTIADGAVHDTLTNLTWQRALDAGSYSQADAANYCAQLTLAGGGWRLPRVSELRTIVDPTRTNPAIDFMIFPITPGDAFWTSTAWVGASGNGWYVSFGVGNSYYDATSKPLRVRCVR